jgi:hypothetical protein
MAASITETHEFAVGARPTLAVRNRAGTLALAAGADGQVHVRVTRRARGIPARLSEAELAQVPVQVVQEGDTIRIAAREAEEFHPGREYSVDFEIVLPRTCMLDLHVNAGTVEARGLQATATAQLNAGTLELRDTVLTGDNRLEVNAGTISLDGALAPGATLSAEVNVGKLQMRLPHETAVELTAKTDVGSVSVDGWPVQITRRIMTQEASGRLGTEPRGSLRLHVNTGSIALSAT